MVTAIGASVGMVIDVKIEKEHKRKTLMGWTKKELADQIMVLEHNIDNLEKVKNNKKFQGRLRKKCESVNFLTFSQQRVYTV